MAIFFLEDQHLINVSFSMVCVGFFAVAVEAKGQDPNHLKRPFNDLLLMP